MYVCVSMRLFVCLCVFLYVCLSVFLLPLSVRLGDIFLSIFMFFFLCVCVCLWKLYFLHLQILEKKLSKR